MHDAERSTGPDPQRSRSRVASSVPANRAEHDGRWADAQAVDDAILVAASRTRHVQETIAADLADDETLDGRDASTAVRRATDLDALAQEAATTPVAPPSEGSPAAD
jgi:hypothetical protein